MKDLFVAIRMAFLLTFITGIIYPSFITFAAHLFFQRKAEGSFLEKNGMPLGSELIAQKFEKAHYFWPRPSAIDYNPIESGTKNLSLFNPLLMEMVKTRQEVLQKLNPSYEKIPSSLLFASGSGLDPHISPYAAYYQSDRIAQARGIDRKIIHQLIDTHTEKRFLGIFGMPRVNVLKLNLNLDKQFTQQDGHDPRP